MFNFLLRLNRSGLITFCGSEIKVEFDLNGDDGMTILKRYENGEFKFRETMVTRHPNIVRSVLTGKKGWGLWVKEWSDGISEGLFSMDEILEEFEKNNIKLPDSFLQELKNAVWKKKYK